MLYRCATTNFYNSILWEVGRTVDFPEGTKVPRHFEPVNRRYVETGPDTKEEEISASGESVPEEAVTETDPLASKTNRILREMLESRGVRTTPAMNKEMLLGLLARRGD
jgi:hypothetical protein